jgi:hypothetical protein
LGDATLSVLAERANPLPIVIAMGDYEERGGQAGDYLDSRTEDGACDGNRHDGGYTYVIHRIACESVGRYGAAHKHL